MATKLFLLLLLVLVSHAAAAPPFLDKCHPDDKSALLQSRRIQQPSHSLLVGNQTPIAALIIVGKLRYLETLAFENFPKLKAPIPVKSLSKLPYLREIVIKSTGISGPIPEFPAGFRSLSSIQLLYNNFSGPLPLSLPKLPKLTAIFFDHNKLSGPIPPSYSKFGGLVLSYNQLSGPLPKSFSSFKIPRRGNLQKFDVYVYIHNKCLCGSPLPSCKK
ncbi:Leucine-rich repeat domain superfamily [Sesbania bispinosa]|nr:Leucine-rich repeat domain superfamily [Sesbania bispinosa]